MTGVGRAIAAVGSAARDATSMHFRHASRVRGRGPEWLRRAADIDPVDIREAEDHAKIVVVRAPLLGDAASALYNERKLWETFPSEEATAIDLLSDSVAEIASENKGSDLYDSHLLSRIESFGTVFKARGVSAVGLGGLGKPGKATSVRTVIDASTVGAAAALSRMAPAPKRVRIAGRLDMVRASDRAFDLLVEDGSRVRGVWEDDIGGIVSLLDKDVVVDAVAVFRPSGALLRIEAGAMGLARAADKFFAKLPTSTPTKIDPRLLRQPQTRTTGLNAVFGKWPGVESEEELLAKLAEND